MLEYCFHGVEVSSPLPLGVPVSVKPPRAVKHLYLKIDDRSDPPHNAPVWQDTFHIRPGVPHTRLYREADQWIIEATESARFRYAGDTIALTVIPGGNSPVPYVLGRVFAVWLELQGVPVLHGSCFATEQGAIGLLADSGTGKTTLAAALVAAGYRLLTDDLVPLLYEGPDAIIYPGIPMSRLWPDTLAALVPDGARATPIHPDSSKCKLVDDGSGPARFASTPLPLRRLFILERGKVSDVRITRLSPAAAVMALIRYSYRPELCQVLGLQAARLPLLAALMQSVCVDLLQYPSGFAQLSQVVACLQNACESRDTAADSKREPVYSNAHGPTK